MRDFSIDEPLRDIGDLGGDDVLREALSRLVPSMPPEDRWLEVRDRADAGQRTGAALDVSTAPTAGSLGGSVGGWTDRVRRWLEPLSARPRRAVVLAVSALALLVVVAGVGAGVLKGIGHLRDGETVAGGGTTAASSSGQTRPTTLAEAGSWQRLSPLPSGECGDYITALAMDPSNPAVLYAGTDSALYKSTDSGATWAALPRPEGQEPGVFRILIDQASPPTLYVVCGRPPSSGSLVKSAGTVTKSTDGGATWTVDDTQGDPDRGMWSLLIDPRDPEVLYGKTADDIVRSTDGGATWHSIVERMPRLAEIPGLGPLSFAVDPLDGTMVCALPSEADLGYVFPPFDEATRIFLIQRARLGFVSSDQGATWSLLTDAALGKLKARLRAAPGTPPAAVLAATGFLQSFMGTLTEEVSGAEAEPTTFFVIDPADPRVIYVGTEYGVYKSTDGGATWSEASTGIPTPEITGATVDPVDTSTIFATSADALYKSTDRGITWNEILQGVGTFCMAPSDDLTLYYVMDWDGGTRVMKSSDGGATWRVVAAPPASGASRLLAVDPTDAATLYAVNEAVGVIQVFKSTDGAATWRVIGGTDLPNHGGVSGLVVDPVAPTVLYVGIHNTDGANGVFKSTDGGTSWRPVRSEGWGPVGVTWIARGSGTSPAIYAAEGTIDRVATGPGTVLRSTDGGSTWQRWPGDPPVDVGGIAVDPAGSSTVYVWGTEPGSFEPGSSLWALPDEMASGDQWVKVGTDSGEVPDTLHSWARSSAMSAEDLAKLPAWTRSSAVIIGDTTWAPGE